MDIEENTNEQFHGIIEPVEIDHEMRTAYIDYSMSVIVSRALPDVRDGLKPVQRRVLFGMDGLGLNYSGQTKKSARIVGEVLGKFHPHGDSSVYDAMARLAQNWNQRYPLVFGQGNFGSMDGDPVAAMRYTEAKLERITEDVLADLDKNTVDFQLNFDDTIPEPTVLPTKAPLLLLNGSAGIAVGMATNMAPHNLSECCDAICAYIDNPDISVEGLTEHIKGPEFPTGGVIQGRQGIVDAYTTGRGRVVVRAKTEIEEDERGRDSIVVTEVPYMVNKSEMIKRIGEMVEEKRIEGISDIRDLSSREGIRIVFYLKKDANANVVLNTLFKYTALQSSFAINNVALVKGRPRTLSLKEIIANFVDFRHEVVVRRTKFDLEKAQKRAHILEGLLRAIDAVPPLSRTPRPSWWLPSDSPRPRLPPSSRCVSASSPDSRKPSSRPSTRTSRSSSPAARRSLPARPSSLPLSSRSLSNSSRNTAIPGVPRSPSPPRNSTPRTSMPMMMLSSPSPISAISNARSSASSVRRTAAASA